MSISLCIYIPWKTTNEIPLYEGMDLMEFLIKRFQPADHIINIIGPANLNVPQGNCIPYNGTTHLQLIQHALEKIPSERILLLGADQVRVTKDFINYLLTLPDYYDIILPTGVKYRPAIYSQSCLEKLKSLDSDKNTLEDLCNICETRYITEDEVYFYEDPEEMYTSLYIEEF
jgi:molybdopterin-guanine dinucleotide biosynthesis protein A